MPPAYTPFVEGDEDEDQDDSGLGKLLARGPDAEDADAAGDAPSTLGQGQNVPRGTMPDLPPSPVYKGSDPNARQALVDKYAQLAKPTDPNAPGIKPGIAQRILGGLAAGAMAYGHVPGALEAGEDAIWSKYNAAEKQRQGNLAAAQTQIAGYDQSRRQADDDFLRATQGYNANLGAYKAQTQRQAEEVNEKRRLSLPNKATFKPSDPANPLGGWEADTVGGQHLTGLQPPDEFLKTKAGIDAVSAQRADKLGLTGDDRKYFLANEGKLADPRISQMKIDARPPKQASGEEIKFNAASSAWQRANPGKTPTLDDIRSITAATEGKAEGGSGGPKRGTPQQFSQLGKETSAAYRKAKDDYNAGVMNADQLAERNSSIGSDHSQRLRDLGGIPAEDSQQQAPPPQQQQAQAAPASNMVRVLKPDGKTVVLVPRQNLGAALKLGGKAL